MTTPRRMLVGSFHGDKILLATALLRWYLEHGLEVTRVYHVVEYTPSLCFRWFSDVMSTARREGDVHSHKAIIADTMKLLGKLGLREDHHQRGSTSRREILHEEGSIAHGQRQTVPTTRRRRRRCVRDSDEQENRHVRPARTRGFFVL